MDVVTLSAAKAADKAYFRDRSPFGTVGQRIFGGRMGTVNLATGTTFQITTELQTDFDAIQIIFANADEYFSYSAAAMSCAVLSSATDLNGASASWKTVTNNSQARLHERISPGAGRIGYTLSDVIPIASVPRIDGGTKPLLAVRAYMSPGLIPVVGNGTDSFTNWATRTDGRLWAMRSQAIDGITVPANFTTTTNISQSPIVGVRYLSRGRVVNVMVVGDSITDGRGTYLGEGFGLPVVEQLNSSGLAFEYSNCGWSGQASSTYAARALDIIEQGIAPDILIFPSGSPNDADPLTQAKFDLGAFWRNRVISTCEEHGIIPILWTMLPCSSAVHDWNASDSLRRDDNARAITMRDRGIFVADTATALSAGLDGDGQTIPKSGSLVDGIHPGDVGCAEMAAELLPLVKKAAGL